MDSLPLVPPGNPTLNIYFGFHASMPLGFFFSLLHTTVSLLSFQSQVIIQGHFKVTLYAKLSQNSPVDLFFSFFQFILYWHLVNTLTVILNIFNYVFVGFFQYTQFLNGKAYDFHLHIDIIQ